MSKSILDGKMVCPVTKKLVYSDQVYVDEKINELVCPCHGKIVELKKRS